MPFEKGQSGNPAGRPPGARNKATVMAELLLQGEAEAMTRLAIERAKAGDIAALRMCLDRLVPPCRHRLIEFELPQLVHAADAVSALAAITAGVASGELTAAEASELSRLERGGAISSSSSPGSIRRMMTRRPVETTFAAAPSARFWSPGT